LQKPNAVAQSASYAKRNGRYLQINQLPVSVVGRKQVDTKSQEAAFFATHYPFAVVKKLFAIKDTELQNDPIEFIPLECYPAAANLINTWSISMTDLASPLSGKLRA